MALVLDGTNGVSLVQDGVVQTADLANNAVTSAKMFSGFANGISEADQWRLNADLVLSTTAKTVLSSNLERVDTGGMNYIGTGMTQSSGIFTFPSTGIWLITANYTFYRPGSTANISGYIDTTVNNSSYSAAAVTQISINQVSGNTFAAGTCMFMFDVSDTSTHKVRFSAETVATSPTVQGGNSNNVTVFTFMRLGDT